MTIIINQLQAMIKEKYNFLKTTKLYSLYKFQHDKTYFVKVFPSEVFAKNNLLKTLVYNQQILTQCKNFPNPQCFLAIERKELTNKGLILFTQPYEYRLNQYLEIKKQLAESQALLIFKQILICISNLYKAGFVHCNLRTEHFVKVGDKWKLESIVCGFKNKEKINSEYFSQFDHLSPELMKGQKLRQKHLNEQVVWNLGCILIQLLTGKHILNSLKVIESYEIEGFVYEKLVPKEAQKVSQCTKDYLTYFCNCNIKSRITIKEVFEQQYFFQQNYKQSPSSEITLQNNYGYEPNDEEDDDDDDKYDQYFNIYSMLEDSQIDSKETIILKNQNRIKYQELLSMYENQSRIDIHVQEDSNPFLNSSLYINMNQMLDDRVSQLYKSKVDKCQLLMMQRWKYRLILYFYPKLEKGQEIALLIRFLVTFASQICLSQLLHPNFQIQFEKQLKRYNIEVNHFEMYKRSYEYNLQQEKIATLKHELMKQLKEVRERIEQIEPKKYVLRSKNIMNIIKKDPQTTDYVQIKDIYRQSLYNQIIKPFTEAINKGKTPQKEKQWSQIIMHATYWISFDKLYKKKEIKNNFQKYFQFGFQSPSFYISSKRYLEYLIFTEHTELMNESASVLNKYFQFEIPE